MRELLAAFIFATASGATLSAPLDQISSQDANAGLKAALERGSLAAVSLLGRTDGYFGNEKVRIPLPESLDTVASVMRTFGMGKYADELVLTMNRAAEAAVPEAKALFVEAVRKMTVQDAKAILTGGETAGTEYFERATSEALRARFLPIVQQATRKVKLAEKYNAYASKGARFGLVGKEDANLDHYVTQKALDGLFYVVAQEERKIRKDPVGTASNIIKKVFGALR